MVTGCTDGIGKAIAEELASRGFNIVMISRSKAKLEVCARELEKSHGVKTRIVAFDVCQDTSIEAYQKLVSEAIKDDMEVSVLINNVGIGTVSAMKDLNDPESSKAYNFVAGNCYPVVLLTQQLLHSKFKARNVQGLRSLIVNLSS